jgi:hypothetical protein
LKFGNTLADWQARHFNAKTAKQSPQERRKKIDRKPDGLPVPKFPDQKIGISMFPCVSLRLLFALIIQGNIAMAFDGSEPFA